MPILLRASLSVDAATLPSPSASSPLSLSSTLWALAQSRPLPQPLASSAAAGPVAVPVQWMEQAADVLMAALSDAVAGGKQAGKEVGGREAGEAQGCRFKACVSGLMSLGQLGYRLGGGRGGKEQGGKAGSGPRMRLSRAMETRRALEVWAQEAERGKEGGAAAAAAEALAALAAVGL